MRVKEGIHLFWQQSAGYRQRILWGMLCGILRIGASLAFVAASKHVIDIATHQTGGTLVSGLLLLVGCMVLQLIFSSLQRYLQVGTDVSMSNRLRSSLLSHLLKSRWTGKEKYHSGDMINRMQEDVDTVTHLLCVTVPSVGITLTQLAGAAVFLIWLDARLGIAMLFIMPLALMLSKVYMHRMRRLTQHIRNTDSRVQSHMQESLQHRTLMAVMERVPTMLHMLNGLQSELQRLIFSRNRFSIFSSLMVQVGFAAGYVTAFSWGVYGLSAGTVTFGMLTAFLQLVAQVQRPVVELSRQLPVFVNAYISLERLNELFSLPLEEQGQSLVFTEKVGVRFDDVSFAYPDSSRPIFQHFTHNFEPGSLTAVLGETGAGKSTLIRMLLALLLPQKGSITLYAGQREEKTSPLTRANFIYVPQGNTLVSGTIRQNLLLGNPQATTEMLNEVLYTAAADFVKNLPKGLDTPCGEHGEGLSEGQAQRIAIARGLLRRGEVVLLDEPTSALDEQTTRLLLERLTEKMSGKTVILITHQQQTAQLCTHTVLLKRPQSF